MWSSLTSELALREGAWEGSAGEAARGHGRKAFAWGPRTKAQTRRLAPLSLGSCVDSLREPSYPNELFLGFGFLWATPLRTAHLKHSYPKRVAQEVRGENQHLSVASAEVNAGQLVQLGVYPV